MAFYNVIQELEEALLVKKNESTGEYAVVQKLVPSTVNGMVMLPNIDGGFQAGDTAVALNSIYHGGVFGFSEVDGGQLRVSVNIPGSGANTFSGRLVLEDVNGVGRCVKCEPDIKYPDAPYTHLCLV